MADDKTITLRIKRQKDQDSDAYWEEFTVPYRRNMNIISCLMEIRKNPVTSDGTADQPAGVGHELPGERLRLLPDGHQRPRRVRLRHPGGQPGKPITLEPLTKFPTMKDLSRGPLAHVREPQEDPRLDPD